MAVINYTKQNFVDGNVLHANELNHMEDGIYDNSNIVSNPNLLRNPFFTVNSRGFTSLTGTGVSGSYTVDGWMAYGYSVATWKTYGKALELIGGGASGSSAYLQFVKGLEPGTYTFSARITSVILDSSDRCGFLQISKGVPSIGDSITSSYITASGIISVTFTTTETEQYDNFRIEATSGGTIRISAAKLEKGSVSTLANDLVTYAPDRAKTNYEIERFRCLTSAADADDTYANMGIGVVKEYTTTVPTTGWNEYSTYATLTVNISNILSTDTPIIDIDTSGSHNISDYVNWKENFAKILKISTSNGSITILAESKFTYSVPIKILCIRK